MCKTCENNWNLLHEIHATDGEIQKIEKLAQIECEELEAYEAMTQPVRFNVVSMELN